MSIDKYFTTSVTVANPAAGDDADAEGVPQVTMVATTVSCAVQPLAGQARSDAEQVLGQEEAQRALLLWFPAGTAITARSTVTIAGELYQVATDPKRWELGTPNDHVEVLATRPVR